MYLIQFKLRGVGQNEAFRSCKFLSLKLRNGFKYRFHHQSACVSRNVEHGYIKKKKGVY